MDSPEYRKEQRKKREDEQKEKDYQNIWWSMDRIYQEKADILRLQFAMFGKNYPNTSSIWQVKMKIDQSNFLNSKIDEMVAGIKKLGDPISEEKLKNFKTRWISEPKPNPEILKDLRGEAWTEIRYMLNNDIFDYQKDSVRGEERRRKIALNLGIEAREYEDQNEYDDFFDYLEKRKLGLELDLFLSVIETYYGKEQLVILGGLHHGHSSVIANEIVIPIKYMSNDPKELKRYNPNILENEEPPRYEEINRDR